MEVDEITVSFSEQILLSSLDAADLTVDGVASATVDLVDADTATFGLPAPVSEGPHTVGIAAGGVTGVSGASVEAYHGPFTIGIPPHVTATSVQLGDRFDPGDVTVIIEFAPAVDTTGIDETDFELSGPQVGQIAVDSWSIDLGGTVLTLNYADLAEDVYTLTLFSGDGRFEGLNGVDLDGETPAWPIGPNVSGDGVDRQRRIRRQRHLGRSVLQQGDVVAAG